MSIQRIAPDDEAITALEHLEGALQSMKGHLISAIPETFWQAFYRGLIDDALDSLAKVRMPKPPAHAPGKHEPEPLILAAKKTPRPRAQKGH